MKNFIKGTYKRSIFQGSNGFVIGLFRVKDTSDDSMLSEVNKTVTFTGYFHELMEDENYIFYGKSSTHPKYGFQYEVSEYERQKPEDKDGLIQFLSSDLFKGIGVKMATKIVETIGNNILDDVIIDYKLLLKVKGLTEDKAKHIYDVLIEYEESHKTIVYLCDLSFSMRDALEIYNYYKKATIETIEKNPYRIYYDINCIGFGKVDSIRDNFNIKEHDMSRVSAGILFTIDELCFQNGNTYLEYEELFYGFKNFLAFDDLSEEVFEKAIKYLVKNNLIVISDNKYYKKKMYEAEIYIADEFSYLTSKTVNKYDLDKNMAKLEKYFNIEYSEKQKKAIIKSINSNVLVITGGPGTGKTTIIKAIVELYRQYNKLEYDELVRNIALLAPTGRAAKRISDQTLLPASTIHSFLKWNRETDEFMYNEYNKLSNKFIIIDEVSMIDTLLMSNLLKALPRDVKIILVGDIDQLPSVGSGQVLKDIIDSDVVETIYLDLLYRQTKDSTIVSIAHDIIDGELSINLDEKKDDFSFIHSDELSILKNVEHVCKLAKKKNYTEKDIQVLAPMYRGQNGIDNLNRSLQKLFNPFSATKKELKINEAVFREGDKVLQLVNMPDDNVYNGDIGYIKKIVSSKESDSKHNEIYIDFDSNIICYKPKDFINFKHGYAISIHKAQGSEFKSIIMPITMNYRRMLTKKIVYTGITRAKESLVIIGEYNALNYGIKNTGVSRKTGLKDILIDKINNNLV